MGLFFEKGQDGTKKPSIYIVLFILGIGLAASFYFFSGNRKTGLEQMRNPEGAPPPGPVPIVKEETTTTAKSNTDAATERIIQEQIDIEREQGGGYLPPERMQTIRAKYEEEYRSKQSGVFRTNQDSRLQALQQGNSNKTQTAPPVNTETKEKTSGYRTFSQRMGGGGGGGGGSAGMTFSNTNSPSNTPPKRKEDTTGANTNPWLPHSQKDFQNMLPLGTYIPCILESDVITTDLASNVWATVALDVTFRRQLQLPKGLVRARGSAATQPVHDMVDIHFDTLVFSDGTELPISGSAYTALDPRYPNRYKTRGIPGELITPPFYLKLQSLLYGAAIGASEAYVDNYINENTETQSSFTTVPVVDPVTGQVTNQVQETQKPPVNTNIGGTIGLSAAQSTLSELLEMAKEDLDKFRPYVMVEKGTPFYIQLDNTIDISRRAINGVAIAAAEALSKGQKLPTQTTFSPGDARARFVDNEGMQAPPLAIQTEQFLNKLNNASGLNQGNMGTGAPRNPPSGGTKPAPQNSQNLQTLETLLNSLRK